MRSCRCLLAGAVTSLVVLSGHAAAMGSGPHPNVAYGIPTVPASGATTDVWVDLVGLLLALLMLVVVIAVLRVFSRRRDL